MSRFDGTTVEARMGECRCAGAPHPDGDVAYLLPRLSFPGGQAAMSVIRAGIGSGDQASIVTPLCEVYIRHQVAGWNLLDDAGDALAFDAELLLSDWEAAIEVADVADGLYSEAILAPFRKAVSTLSPRGRTAASTSRRTRSSRSTRRSSGRSTTATTTAHPPTGSPTAGGSRSSRTNGSVSP